MKPSKLSFLSIGALLPGLFATASLAQSPGIIDLPVPVSAAQLAKDKLQKQAEAERQATKIADQDAARKKLAERAQNEEARRKQAEAENAQLKKDLAAQAAKSKVLEQAAVQAEEDKRQKHAEAERQAQSEKRRREEADRAPGTQFQDTLKTGGQGPLMVVLPPGRYWMGPKKAPGQVEIKYKLAVGKFPITFDDWAQCVAGGGCKTTPKPNANGWGTGKRPVINVDTTDAGQYLAWLNENSVDKSSQYRLLSEMEYEYALRGEQDGKKDIKRFARLKMENGEFSSGDCIHTDHGNYDGNYDWSDCGAVTGVYRRRTVEVGSLRSENRFGLFDMQGNVWSWVADCDSNSYPDRVVWTRTNEKDGGAAQCRKDDNLSRSRVMRGGSWKGSATMLGATSRSSGQFDTRSDDVGFRIARTVP